MDSKLKPRVDPALVTLWPEICARMAEVQRQRRKPVSNFAQWAALLGAGVGPDAAARCVNSELYGDRKSVV